MRGLLLSALLLLGALVLADSPTRAKQHYQLHCMGCHGEDGAGLEGHVPSLRGTLSRISKGELGRDYVLRVPGVTQSSLSSEDLAEVLNWAIREFSDAEAAGATRPFTATEVATARTRPLLEIGPTRAKVLSEAR
jgi:mono/diheme cytochrome c family protein